MRGKKVGSQMLKEIKQSLEAEKDHVSLEKLEAKISIRDMTLEERVQEASKPLYLKRYE